MGTIDGGHLNRAAFALSRAKDSTEQNATNFRPIDLSPSKLNSSSGSDQKRLAKNRSGPSRNEYMALPSLHATVRGSGKQCKSCAPAVRSGPGEEAGAGVIGNARLVAIDLDGTLVKDDGHLDPRDVTALRDAIQAGVVVTIATGRLSAGTVSTARRVGVDGPIICADGAAMVCAHTGETLEEQAIDFSILDRILGILSLRPLAPFVFVHNEAHGDALGRDFTGYMKPWATRLSMHPRLCNSRVFRDKAGVLVAFGLGDRDDVEKAQIDIELACGDRLDVSTFQLQGADWAVRAQRRGSSKGACLARLAARLGIDRTRVAAVGDGYDDVTMLAWAGRSFAMGQAPEAVRAAATDQLSATAETGGGIAEALDRWL
jgi:Cof subfamily protein (haloacid dehalogenase superfamily)